MSKQTEKNTTCTDRVACTKKTVNGIFINFDY